MSASSTNIPTMNTGKAENLGAIYIYISLPVCSMYAENGVKDENKEPSCQTNDGKFNEFKAAVLNASTNGLSVEDIVQCILFHPEKSKISVSLYLDSFPAPKISTGCYIYRLRTEKDGNEPYIKVEVNSEPAKNWVLVKIGKGRQKRVNTDGSNTDEAKASAKNPKWSGVVIPETLRRFNVEDSNAKEQALQARLTLKLAAPNCPCGHHIKTVECTEKYHHRFGDSPFFQSSKGMRVGFLEWWLGNANPPKSTGKPGVTEIGVMTSDEYEELERKVENMDETKVIMLDREDLEDVIGNAQKGYRGSTKVRQVKLTLKRYDEVDAVEPITITFH